jgi:hypothetical protein
MLEILLPLIEQLLLKLSMLKKPKRPKKKLKFLLADKRPPLKA